MNKISPAKYQQLLGLRLLADRHNEALKDIEKAAPAITGEQKYFGHTSDWVYGSRTTDELLKLLEIEITPQRASGEPQPR